MSTILKTDIPTLESAAEVLARLGQAPESGGEVEIAGQARFTEQAMGRLLTLARERLAANLTHETQT